MSSREDVWRLISQLDVPGETSTGGSAPSLPCLPGLDVEGVGLLPLPLNEETAYKLAGVAVQAPHGKGTETVVDTTVRNTLQVDADLVTLRNPRWDDALDKQVALVAEALGVNKSNVRAELYKLLLYEPGSFFKRHKDTEKADGMFGTLVIQLPSTFTGGTFEVNHAGKEKVYTMGAGDEAAYGCHFVAHYADCDHEIKPVETGYRLALVYSLCYNGNGETPSAAALGGTLSEIAAALRSLPEDETMLVLNMEHEYTTASLARYGVGCLKGADKAKYKALNSASEGTYTFVVACAERVDCEMGDGGYYYGDFDVHETEEGRPHLNEVFNADGTKGSAAIKKLHIDWEVAEEGGAVLCSQEEVEEMWGDGDEGGVEYTGNEGASRETTYHCCVLLAYRKDAELELLMGADLRAVVRDVVNRRDPAELTRVVEYVKKHGARILELDDFRVLIRSLITTFANPAQANVVEMIRVVLSHANGLDASLVDELVDAVRRCGWAALGSVIAGFFQRMRKSENYATSTIPKRAELALKLVPQIGSDVMSLMCEVGSDLVTALESPSTNQRSSNYGYSYYGYGYRQVPEDRSDVLSAITLKVFFRACKPDDLARFVKWAEKAEEPALKRAVDSLPAEGAEGGEKAAQVRNRIISRQREAKLAVLEARRAKLENETRNGEPAFTWCMPTKATGVHHQILAYIRGTENGSKNFVVGGGIKNARGICTTLTGNHYDRAYRAYGAYGNNSNSNEANILQRGHSVTATPSGSGASATIAVCKTRAYHEATVSKYRRLSAELADVRKEIKALGGGEAGPSSSAPPSKKARTAGPDKSASTKEVVDLTN
ncbi:hypothetical protein PPROV_000283800 [Pycnococcus provasolii]|uniref:Fe2OG dioxygenase domain-containing protein n=1 Tax=Pycnococcus provasolii TaxID=41880 RepID=A0A830HAG6_9CHLO|nr:hypothetical protein PPROV_000283800 [Pycnococcus provasolii]